MSDEAAVQAQPPVDVKPRVTYSYAVLLLDVVLRWMVWALCRPMGQHELRLWLLQVLLVPILVAALASVREEKVRRRARIAEFAGVVPEATMMRLSVNAFALCMASLMAWRHLPQTLPPWLRVTLMVVGTLGYLFYLFMLWPASIRVDEEPEPMVPAQRTAGLMVDENDRCIIELEAKKESLKQRVDTYTLESALFGALAFSAFVTIVATEHQNADGVRDFADGIVQSVHYLLRLQFPEFWAQFVGTDPKKLFAVIAFDTLICSLMFLAVIICRLRFTDLLNRAECSIRMASSYNEKEDEIHMMQLEHEHLADKLKGRLEHLTSEIDSLLRQSERELRQLRPVLTYMSGFRRAGVVGFLVVLVTSALWIAPLWALGFTFFGVIAFFYPVVDRWIRDSQLNSSLVARVTRAVRPSFLGGEERAARASVEAGRSRRVRMLRKPYRSGTVFAPTGSCRC